LRGVTARAYAILARRYPKAGGAAVFVNEGFGSAAGRLAGIAVAATGIISSGVIVLAFSGYVGALIDVPGPLPGLILVAVIAVIASIGVRESIMFAAAITLLEVGTLLVVALAGLPTLATAEGLSVLTALPHDRTALDLTIAAAGIAFFAFIGFEDIVNMAEEAKRPERTMGPAIAITLVTTTLLYVIIGAIAAASPHRNAIAASGAPLSDLFAGLTGLPAAPISAIAAISMINGVLVQIVMASRILYGMSRDGLMPAWLGSVSPRRRTPVRATMLVSIVIAALALTAPLLALAQASSYVTLAVFAAVNLSLFRIASGPARWWGIAGAALVLALLAYEGLRLAGQASGQ
jgi:amino acid transporter